MSCHQELPKSVVIKSTQSLGGAPASFITSISGKCQFNCSKSISGSLVTAGLKNSRIFRISSSVSPGGGLYEYLCAALKYQDILEA